MPNDSPKITATTKTATQSELGAEELVRDNISWMLALAERLLRDRALAEDAVQEAFVSVFRGIAAFEGAIQS